MDITETLAPRSDQQNFEDYLTGPKLVTISGVSQGNLEQPVNIELAEFPGRPYKPNKTMRRLIVSAWGASTDSYIGRRMKLVGNPAVFFGGKPVGGVEVEALSHIDKPVTVALSVSRGKRKNFTVQPLTEPARRNWLEELKLAGNNIDAVTALGGAARAANAPAPVIAALLEKHAELSRTVTASNGSSEGANRG